MRRGKLYAADMALYSMQMASDNSKEISRLKRNLIRGAPGGCDRAPAADAADVVMPRGITCGRSGSGWGGPVTISRTIKRGGSGDCSAACAMGAEAYLRNMD